MPRFRPRTLVAGAAAVAALLTLVLPLVSTSDDPAPREYDPPETGVVVAKPPAYLRYPNAQPLPMSTVSLKELTGEKGPSGPLVSYDMTTGTTTTRESVSLAEILGPRYTAAGIGVQQLLENPEEVQKNFGSWNIVDPTFGNYPRRVKMWMRFRDTDGILHHSLGSGTLIDPSHVLTAGHCVYAHTNEDQGWVYNSFAESVTIAPGYEDSVFTFGQAEAEELHTFTAWINDHDYDYDVGIVDLDWPIGVLAGWCGYGHHPDCDWFYEGAWTHAAYPAEDGYDGEFMFENLGTFDWCFTPLLNQIAWENDSYGGTSGGGAIRDEIVWAVRSRRLDDIVFAIDCPLDSDIFDQVANIIAIDTPGTVDFHALMLRGDYNVQAGTELDPLQFVIINDSSAAWSGSISYDVYLSGNDQISTYDRMIYSAGITADLGPKGFATVLMPTITIPNDVQAGDHWLGVILDINDADINNNDTSGWQAMPLSVYCGTVYAPGLLAPPNGIDCLNNTSVTCDWGDMDTAMEYQLEVGTACESGVQYTTSPPQSMYTLTDLIGNTQYFWRVRQRSACTGNWGYWSSCRSFTTRPDPTVAPFPIYPLDEAHCVPPDTTIVWHDLNYAVGYEFQIGTVCAEGTPQEVTTSQIDVSLRAGKDYYWRVRTETDCGDWTDWGPCHHFRTTPDDVKTPEVISPVDGSLCESSNAVLFWMPDDEVVSWDVQFGLECGTGTISNTTERSIIVAGLSAGNDYVWRVRANHECGMVSDWTPCRTFQVDQTPPTSPTNLVSSTHTPGTWSNDNTVSALWEPASDECVGVLYSVLWDQSPNTIPDDQMDITMTGNTSGALEDGDNHWFHLRTFDQAGNEAPDVLHLGPFMVDTTAPTAPDIFYATLDENSPGGHFSVWCAWDPATDETSGLAGYSWVISSSQLTNPDETVETTDTFDRERFTAEGSSYFHVRAVDQAGNTGPKSFTGPFVVDLDLIMLELRYPNVQNELVEGESFDIVWDLDIPLARIVIGGELSYSTNAGQTWHVISSLRADAVLAGSYAWTPPAAGTETGAIRLMVEDIFKVEVVSKSELFTLVQVTGAPEEELPGRFALVGNIPNPFNPQTTIVYDLPYPTQVSLQIFDLKGHLVRTLAQEWQNGPQRHAILWNGTDNNGRQLVSGVYLYRLSTGNFVQTKRMTMVR